MLDSPRGFFVLILVIASLAVGCRKSPTQQPASSTSGDRYSSRGKIVSLSPEEADIHHERIPAIRGYDGTVKPMSSMTMPFARTQASFEGIAVGDAVEFEFTVHYDAEPTLRLTRIVKLPPGTTLELH